MRDASARKPPTEGRPLTPTADPASSPPVVPDWLAQAAGLAWRLLVVVAFSLVVLAGAAVLGTVVASVVLAAAVTAAFDPLAERLRAAGRPPTVVAGLVMLAAIALGAGALAVVAIAVVPASLNALRAIDAGVDAAERLMASGQLPDPIVALLGEIVDGVTRWVSTALGAIASSVASTATIVLLAVFLLFFLVNDADRAIGWALQLADDRQRAQIDAAARTARRRLGRSLRETAFRAAVMGLVALAVALVLGLPAPLALAVLVFAGGFVPLLGLLAATVAVGLVALGSGGGGAAVAAVTALAVATVLLPRLPGRGRLSGSAVHPAVVLVALTVGSVVAGPLGLILAVPVVIVLKEVVPAILAALNATSSRPSAAGLVPPWLDVLAHWSWRLLLLVAVAAAAVVAVLQVPLIVGPVVIAAVLAATLAPGVAALLRRGATPTTAALAMTVGGFGLVLAILGLTLAGLAGPIREVAENASIGAGLVDQVLGSGETVASVVAAIAPEIVRAFAIVVAIAVGLVVALVLGAILTFYLLRDGVHGFEVATARLTPWRRDELADAAGRATGVLGGYMLGTGAISAFGAATQFLIMWILGIPLALPLAVLALFGGYIPYIGSLLVTGLAFLVTVAVGTTQDVVIMAIFTIVFNIVQGNIVAPLVYGRAVSIHPAIVLLAIPAGSAVAGIVGMFLAVPAIGIVATTWRTVLRVFGHEPADRAGFDGAGDAGVSEGVSPATDVAGPPVREAAVGDA